MDGRNAYLRSLERIGHSTGLDGAVAAWARFGDPLVKGRPLRRFLSGVDTGIPPHVVLTDVPFGAWFMAVYLDLFPNEEERRAARRLVGLGVLAALPTGLAGLAEWASADTATRRVGVLHSTATTAATLVFAGSWIARRTGRNRLGINLARAGSAVAIAGGFLGGYMGSRVRGRHGPVKAM